MKKLLLGLLTIMTLSCNEKYGQQKGILDHQKELISLPRYYPEKINSRQVDLRNADLSKLELTGRQFDLMHSVFDNYTIWPARLPDHFDPELLIGNNLNPGLNIRNLHKKGIDGSGIRIAVIDLPISFLSNDLKKENISIADNQFVPKNIYADYFHGHAVLSILAGQVSGVAPNSEVLYLETAGFNDDDEFSCENEVHALNYILEYSKNNKIDIVSISSGANKERPFYREYLDKIKELEESGIPVISPSIQVDSQKYHFYGLERNPYANADKISNYKPIEWHDWINKISSYPGLLDEYLDSYKSGIYRRKTLLIPLDPKSYHGYLDEDHFIYSFTGGWSWIPPYIAGLYALSKQVNGLLTFGDFWNLAYATGTKYQFQANGEILYASIVDPEKMVENIKKRK